MKHKEKFKSSRQYKILMYSIIHSILIIRSEKQYFDVNYEVKYDKPNLTIDIIFTAVDFISIPVNLTI